MVRISQLCMTYEEAFKLFRYNPITGEFITALETSHVHKYKKPRPPVRKRTNKKSRFHACFLINGDYRRATHLAYLLMKKELLPEGMAVFLNDGDPLNLRWTNLIVAPQNCGGVLDQGRPPQDGAVSGASEGGSLP